MRIILNVKEIGRKIGIEAKLDTGCQDTARERAAGEALFHHLGDHFATMEQTAKKLKALFGGKR
ncbi:MAG: hypothetical protein BWX70_03261 [Verrucomicrobia bacterium ADurb.Bin070]|nr:MAG: hypothetical protein BWX70_03261 [Verrucomicrobia bacterium ADurb.Bin070]